MRLGREDLLRLERGAAVLVTADAVRGRVARALLEIRIRAPRRRTLPAVHRGERIAERAGMATARVAIAFDVARRDAHLVRAPRPDEGCRPIGAEVAVRI